MNLSHLLGIINSHPGYNQLIQWIERSDRRETTHGLLNALRTPFVASLSRDISRPILYLVPRADRLLTRSEELPLWNPQLEVINFPDPGPLFYEWAPWSVQVRTNRASVLASMTCGMGPGSPGSLSSEVFTHMESKSNSI